MTYLEPFAFRLHTQYAYMYVLKHSYKFTVIGYATALENSAA